MDSFLKESIFTSAICDVMMVHVVALLLHLHLNLVRVQDVDDLRVLNQLRLSQVPENVLLQLRRVLIVIHDGHGDPEVSVEQFVQLKVLVILAKRIVQRLSHPEPAKYEEESGTREPLLIKFHVAQSLCKLEVS